MGGVIQSSLLASFHSFDDEEDFADFEQEYKNESSSCSLSFSQNHGKNVQLSKNCLIARRLPGNFCNAIVFTNQPITPFGFSVRINKMASNWSGCLRVGFTSRDPSRLNPRSLPKSLIPDLAPSKKGYWAKSLESENLCSGDVVNVWVDSAGLAKYTVISRTPHILEHSTNEACTVFLENLPITDYLWPVFDVYGNCTEIELLPTQPIFPITNRQSNYSLSLVNSPSSIGQEVSSNNSLQRNAGANATAAAFVTNSLLIELGSNVLLPDDLFDIFFHPTCGSKVKLSRCSTVAIRDPDSYHDGLVFVNSPLLCNRTYLFAIMEKAERCLGNLRIGVTSCNPSTLSKNNANGGPTTWPSDSFDFASVRPEKEFWNICQITHQCNVGDVIAVFVTRSSGRSANNLTAGTRFVMYNVIRPNTNTTTAVVCPSTANCNDSSRLESEWERLCEVSSDAGQIWLLIDLFGKTNSVALIGMTTQFRPEDNDQLSGGNSMVTTTDSTSARRRRMLFNDNSDNVYGIANGAISQDPYSVRITRSPPPGDNIITSTHFAQSSSSLSSAPNEVLTDNDESNTVYSKIAGLEEGGSFVDANHNVECAVCMQYASGTVIYDCGHCCLCYTCAHDLLRLKHHCPICRRPIKDVIKVFYS